MQFEEFDKKIREAASHHHPAYDEQAWDKMHKLLDKHLPEEKDDRRRILFFLLLFLLLGGGIWWIAVKPAKQSQQAVEQKQPSVKNENNTEKKRDGKYSTVAEKNNESSAVITEPYKVKENVAVPVEAVVNNKQPGQLLASFNKNKKEKLLSVEKSIAPVNIENKAKELVADKIAELQNDKSSGIVNDAVKKDEAATGTVVKPMPSGNVTDEPAKQTITDELGERMIVNNAADENKKPLSKPVETEKKEGDKKVNTPKAKSKKSSYFFVSLSAGPDVSYTTGGELGTTKMFGGIGLGYIYKNKISLRTGFYGGRKVYAAAPDAYNPPAVFWNYYPYLEKVDADCRVYEIPVLVSYHFGKSTKQKWFVSGGLSSLIMKQEDYHYAYKYTPGGATHYKDWIVKNENKHFFSVATISGGYQKNIGKSVTLTAEPYLKLPLSGVGYGKVKLNSTGILFSLSVKPFQQIKKP